MTTPASTFSSLIRGENDSEGSHAMKIAGQAYVQQSSKYPSHEAAYAAGAEAMRERAAKVLEKRAAGFSVDKDQMMNWSFTEYIADAVRTEDTKNAAAIRALLLPESKP